MATAQEVTRAAFQLILTQESEGDYSASEYEDAIFALNNMMAAWESAEHIRLGFTPIASLSDRVTVDNGAIRGIVANLAVELAPQFDAEITAGLALQASDGVKACRLIGQSITPVSLPSNLPIGSGSTNYGFNTQRFYSGAEYQGTFYAVKDPDTTVSYTIAWADVLSQPNDTISSSSWTATAGVTVDSDSNTTTTASAVVSGGTEGSICQLVNTVVTAAGMTYQRTYVLTIQDK